MSPYFPTVVHSTDDPFLHPVFLSAAQQRRLVAAPATSLVVEAKQNSLKRQRTAERSRAYNRSRKTEISTRIKKVFTALDAFKAAPPASEADLAPVQTLLSEAYQVIDKAVGKGILHRNTAARRKARMAKARQGVLIQAGLYTPA
jgi:small subunit ribosomal protein S20